MTRECGFTDADSAARLPSGTAVQDIPELFRSGDYDALVHKALPLAENDALAARYLVWTFGEYGNPFFFGDGTVAEIGAAALQGNKYALFGKGCHELYTQPHHDSCKIAEDCFAWALELGLSEAGAALSQMFFRGDSGRPDYDRANSLITEALQKNCPFAAKLMLKDMVFGRLWMAADPKEALLESQRLEREEPDNPWWPYLSGCAVRELEGLAASVEHFRKAASLGLRAAWGDLAVACSHDEGYALVDRPAYLNGLKLGVQHGDHTSQCMIAFMKVEDYESKSQLERALASRQLVLDLETACSWGSMAAAEYLGDIYLEGLYDVAADAGLAWEWYSRGAELASDSCCEKMYGMMRQGLVERDLRSMDLCALKGARLGSDMLLGETVIAYSQGRLEDFSDEIERFYVPVFDDGDDGSDDFPDDDGRYDAYA